MKNAEKVVFCAENCHFCCKESFWRQFVITFEGQNRVSSREFHVEDNGDDKNAFGCC